MAKYRTPWVHSIDPFLDYIHDSEKDAHRLRGDFFHQRKRIITHATDEYGHNGIIYRFEPLIYWRLSMAQNPRQNRVVPTFLPCCRRGDEREGLSQLMGGGQLKSFSDGYLGSYMDLEFLGQWDVLPTHITEYLWSLGLVRCPWEPRKVEEKGTPGFWINPSSIIWTWGIMRNFWTFPITPRVGSAWHVIAAFRWPGSIVACCFLLLYHLIINLSIIVWTSRSLFVLGITRSMFWGSRTQDFLGRFQANLFPCRAWSIQQVGWVWFLSRLHRTGTALSSPLREVWHHNEDIEVWELSRTLGKRTRDYNAAELVVSTKILYHSSTLRAVRKS